MAKGKRELSPIEEELRAAMSGELQASAPPIREAAPPAGRVETKIDPEPESVDGPAPADEEPVTPSVTTPPSVEVIEHDGTPVTSESDRVDNMGDLGERCVGTVTRLIPGHDYGFLEVDGVVNVFFSHKVCYGLFRALRPGDRVSCYVKDGARGLWAHNVSRVWVKA